MISARLIGRLGNSMFQIAASLEYARKYGYRWAAQEQVHNNESSIHRVYPHLPKTPYGGSRYEEHPNRFCRVHNMHMDQCHFDFHEIPDQGDNIVLCGFFQSWKYFQHNAEEVKTIFALPHVPGFEDHVSIHVRRGDYVKYANSFPPITPQYVSMGIDELRKSVPVTKALVFSDDIQWCQENLRHHGVTFEFMRGDERADLSHMASCGHHIIANSTFSWWGAYLGHNPDRIVISPSCKRGSWFGWESGVKKDCVDLLPPEWKQIEFR